MTNSQHAAGLGENCPTPAQHKELFAQEASGIMTKKKMQKVLKGQFLSFDEAVRLDRVKNIMGKDNFFGPLEWYSYFGRIVDANRLSNFAPIPWSDQELLDLEGKHILFWGNEFLEGRPLNSLMWAQICREIRSGFEIDFQGTDVLLSSGGSDFLKSTCKPRWYLMPVEKFPQSTNKYYDDQLKLLAEKGYESVTLVERLTGMILYYVLCKECMDPIKWAITSDTFSVDQVMIRFPLTRVCIGTDSVRYKKDDMMGVAATLKLP